MRFHLLNQIFNMIVFFNYTVRHFSQNDLMIFIIYIVFKIYPKLSIKDHGPLYNLYFLIVFGINLILIYHAAYDSKH